MNFVSSKISSFPVAWLVLALVLLLSLPLELLAPPDPQAQARQIRFVGGEGGRRYLFISDIAGYYGMQYHSSKDSCAMLSPNGSTKVTFVYEKSYGSINGTMANYMFPIMMKGSDALLSEQDFFLVVDPVLRNRSIGRQNIRVIMLDPGHGGPDNGAQGRMYKEKDLALQMAKKLRASLLAKGYSVIMTREDDSFPSLQDRVDLCKKVKPDLYISVHCNASTDKSVNGVETYCPTPAKAPSTGDSKPGYNAYSANAFDKNNYRLAYEIQSSMVVSTKEFDKGVKHARFFVIKNAICPAVLVETGFVSNPSEEMNLASAGRQAAVVSAIVTGVEHYAAATK